MLIVAHCQPCQVRRKVYPVISTNVHFLPVMLHVAQKQLRINHRFLILSICSSRSTLLGEVHRISQL